MKFIPELLDCIFGAVVSETFLVEMIVGVLLCVCVNEQCGVFMGTVYNTRKTFTFLDWD